MPFNGSTLVALLWINVCISGVASQGLPSFDYVPSKATKDLSTVNFLSRPNSFDAPYVSPVNTSVFEWWWFEAFARNLKSSLTVIFFTTSGQAFPLSGDTDNEVTTVFVSGLLPNGTVFYDSLLADGAVFASRGPFGESVAAEFLNSGAKFSGSPDLSKYLVQIKTHSMQGELQLTSSAPAHYVCSADLSKKQDLQVFPHIGWSNAQPAAKARLNMRIGDQVLNFTNGFGYHDHNWGDAPFTSVLQSWYWGHAILGPYTIVWFDGIGSDGNEYVSGYLAMGNEVLHSSCAPGSLKVRPHGGKATYPPHPGPEHAFKYLEVTLRLGEGKQFSAKVYPQSKNIRAPPLYTRWLGRLSGGIVGEKQYNGLTAFEEFTVY